MALDVPSDHQYVGNDPARQMLCTADCKSLALSILTSFWLRVKYRAMRYTPWIRLASWRTDSLGKSRGKAGSGVSKTILVDYLGMCMTQYEVRESKGRGTRAAGDEINKS